MTDTHECDECGAEFHDEDDFVDHLVFIHGEDDDD